MGASDGRAMGSVAGFNILNNKLLTVKHRFFPVTKEIHSDGESIAVAAFIARSAARFCFKS